MNRNGTVESENWWAVIAPLQMTSAENGGVSGKHGDFQVGGPLKEYPGASEDAIPRDTAAPAWGIDVSDPSYHQTQPLELTAAGRKYYPFFSAGFSFGSSFFGSSFGGATSSFGASLGFGT
jgi:hypothetical protein